MTDRMKTVCVGRFLIDVPEQAQVRLKMAMVNGFEITRSDESDEAFAARLARRESELSTKPNMLGQKNIESRTEVHGDSFSGRVLVHSRYRSYSIENERRVYGDSISVEGHVHGDGVSLSFVADTFDPAQVDLLPSILSQLESRPDDAIPTSPGFCLNGAFLRDRQKENRAESIAMFASLPGHPDFGMVFWMNAASVRGPGLVERNAAAMDGLMRARSRSLREGPRSINGLAGEEVGFKVTELNFATVFGFEWETRGTDDDVAAPHLSFEINSGLAPRAGGTPVQSSLSEDAMLKLWDKISGSIRLRPTVPEKVAKAEPPLTPLGAYAEAGERCPQSGWWLCGDAGRGVGVLGGERQYLREGQKMPQALLLPPQTLWQKVRGLQPSYESHTRTAWKLVDKRFRERSVPVVPLAQATLVAQADAGSAIDSAFSTALAGVPIGCCVKSGMQCPASGWWRCEESSALDGTRWFAAGSLLPAATFALPASGFGRVSGKPETVGRRSVWQLVRHAPEAGQETASMPPDAELPGEHDAPATS